MRQTNTILYNSQEKCVLSISQKGKEIDTLVKKSQCQKHSPLTHKCTTQKIDSVVQ